MVEEELRDIANDLGLNDTLRVLFKFQRAYQRRLGCADVISMDHARRNVLYAYAELGEILNAIPDWRWHRSPTGAPPDVEMIAEEAVDLLVFVINIMIHSGTTIDDFHGAVAEVLKKNIKRIESGKNVSFG
jgi:NTP pyrophosphatase (non-canonical NTP hydrolase)